MLQKLQVFLLQYFNILEGNLDSCNRNIYLEFQSFNIFWWNMNFKF